VASVLSIWSAAIHRRLGRANSLARAEPGAASHEGEMNFALEGGDESPHSKLDDRRLGG